MLVWILGGLGAVIVLAPVVVVLALFVRNRRARRRADSVQPMVTLTGPQQRWAELVAAEKRWDPEATDRFPPITDV